jgi:hypothetical protein
VKKPDKTKNTSTSATPQDDTPLMPKKDAAAPGVITATDIGTGDGKKAAALGGEIKPIDSTLLGDKTGQSPAAERKPAQDQGPADAKVEKGKVAEAKADAKPGSASEKPTSVPSSGSASSMASTSSGSATSSAPSSAPARKVTVQKTGFWPVVLGGVVAAGLGSAATIWALPHLPAGWLPEQPAPAAAPAAPEVDAAAIRNDAVAAAQSATAEQIDALRAELAAQAEQGAQQSAPAGPTEEDLAALRQQVEQQAARVEELAARPQIDPDMAARIQTLADQAGALEQQIQTAAQAAQAQINAAQAEAQQLQEAAAESTRRAEAVAAVASLQSALDQGVNPDEARQTLEGAGLQAPEALTREVPSLDSLQAEFPQAARAALRTSLRQDSAAGNGNLLTNFLRAQTGARSVEARDGSDPDAILSRADGAVEEDRIADALTEIEALPEEAKAAPAMAEWLAGATAYRDAQAALSDLSAPSN